MERANVGQRDQACEIDESMGHTTTGRASQQQPEGVNTVARFCWRLLLSDAEVAQRRLGAVCPMQSFHGRLPLLRRDRGWTAASFDI